MEFLSEEPCKQNEGVEFNTHVCLKCNSCIEGLDHYVSHMKNACITAEEDEKIILEEYKKKERQLKKDLSTLKMNVVEKEGQLKDIQNKILRHEKTGHKVKTAQLKIKSEELVISKKELKQLKLKYNKLLCYLKEHEHEIDQTEKKGDTPEKLNDQISPKVEKKTSSSKIASVKFSDKKHSPEKRKESYKEKNRLIIQDSLFKKPKRDKKEQTNVTDSGRHLFENKDKKDQTNVIDSGRLLFENHSTKLSCSETVSTNLKESSVVGINPKHSKTTKNESIKDDKFCFSNKIKQGSNKPEKSPSLEPITESTQLLATQSDHSHVTPSKNIKHNIASKAKDSLNLYRKTDISSYDTSNETQSTYCKSKDDGIKVNQSKDQEKRSEKTLQHDIKNEKSTQSISQQSTIEFTDSQQSITAVDSEADNGKPTANLEKPIKPILKPRVALSKDSECPTSAVKVENVTHQSPISAKNSKSNNESVLFLQQIQLPPNNEIRVLPRVSTPICKEEKLEFVDPELSAIISGDEVSHGVDESVYLLSTSTPEDPKESKGHTTLNKKSPKAQKEFGGINSKNKINITERVKDKVKSNTELKDQAKNESHNEAMILETDLDNEVFKTDNNSEQCLDNETISIYSPQDTIKTLSLSGSEFLTVSEATKTPTKADKSGNSDSENVINSDKNAESSFKNDNLSIPFEDKTSDTLKNDGESSNEKSSEIISLSEKTQELSKERVDIKKSSDKVYNSHNVEKVPAAIDRSANVKTSEFTSLSKVSSCSQKQKVTMEKIRESEGSSGSQKLKITVEKVTEAKGSGSQKQKITMEKMTESKGSSGSQKQKITMEKITDKLEKSDNIEKLPTATVKPLKTASPKLPNNEVSRRDKRKLHPEGLGSTEKRTRINSTNANDGVWHPSNYRRGGSNSSQYQSDRFRPSYDPSHHPRPGVLRVPYQRPSRPPWHSRGSNSYRPRMHNQNHYNWNYRW